MKNIKKILNEYTIYQNSMFPNFIETELFISKNNFISKNIFGKIDTKNCKITIIKWNYNKQTNLIEKTTIINYYYFNKKNIIFILTKQSFVFDNQETIELFNHNNHISVFKENNKIVSIMINDNLNDIIVLDDNDYVFSEEINLKGLDSCFLIDFKNNTINDNKIKNLSNKKIIKLNELLFLSLENNEFKLIEK